MLLLSVPSFNMLVAQGYTQFVNPFIGTSNYGATHPGAVLPQGLASVVPFNVAFKRGEGNVFEKDSEWHSRPYVYENSYLTGFSHINLSGVGCPDLGSILIMPTTDELELNAELHGSTISDQKAVPGYYSCALDKYRVHTEVTATTRCGMTRITYPPGKANLLLNLGLGLTNESGAMLRIVNDREVEGYKLIGTFCYHPEDVRPVYFVMRLSRPGKTFGAWKKMPDYTAEAAWTKYDNTYKPYPNYRYEMAGEDIGTYFTWDFSEKSEVIVKIGISYVSIENARENLDSEMPDFQFAKYQKQASDTWEEALSRIRVKGGSQEDKIVFYTALYHLLLHPNVLQDVDGSYPLMEQYGTNVISGRNRYTVFSLWDTYRNVHPFYSLVYPKLQSDLTKSMLDMYREGGFMPKWELLSMETGVMVGDPAAPVIADTYLRGIRDFDIKLAYEALIKGASLLDNNPLRPGIRLYDSLGYIPENAPGGVGGTVSTTLEYNISDWNIAQLAKELGNESDYKFYHQRAQSFINYFDPVTQMLRPKMEDGSWLTPFDPEAGKNFTAVIGFIEGNAWQYRFYVPHNIPKMINLLGGGEKFVQALDECFNTDNYDMANEPDITYAYLFNFVKGFEWKTQAKVRELIRKYYNNTPAGIPGNDDTGTLSCWLLYGMMGFYPHCPGDMSYALTSPIFDEISIDLDPQYYSGKNLTIKTIRDNDSQLFIKRIKWNNKKHQSFFIDHDLLTEGGVLEFHLSDTPRK